jgi:tRNA(Ile)-lysidine synthase
VSGGSPLDPLRAEPALLLAVSGGPDSTALLLMAAEWAGGPALHAATVDHGLRPESAGEAEAVAALAARLGVPHRILRWQGEKPRTRLQERARAARYALLAEEAQRVGAKVVVTAHHLDDQAETVLMRLARGSGIGGLAGMAARIRRGEIEIARPLLGVAKAELVAFCDARGIAYAHDPSNANPAFARPRLRRLAESLAAEGLDAAALARLARRAALAEDALARMSEAAEARLGLARNGRCDAQALAAEPPEIVRRVLTAALLEPRPSPPPLRGRVREGGPPDPPPLEAMERLTAELIAAIAERRRFAANVAGALIAYDGRGSVSVAPEPPRRAPGRAAAGRPVKAMPTITSASPAQAEGAIVSPRNAAPRISPTNGTT